MSSCSPVLELNEYDTLCFLNLYKMEPVLYNTKLVQYKSRSLRTAAAKRIAAALNIPEFGPREVIVKFRILMRLYCEELKKIAESERLRITDKQKEIYKPQFVWFATMHSFIRRFVQETQVNLVSQSPDASVSTDTQDQAEPAAAPEDRKPDLSMLNRNNSRPLEAALVQAPRQQEMNISPAHNLPAPKRHRGHPRESTNDFNANLMERLQGLCHTTTQMQHKKEDVYEHYGKYIAAVLRGLPPQRSLNLQRQIHELVYEEQMLSLVDASPQNEPSSSRSLVECCLYPSTSSQDGEICVS